MLLKMRVSVPTLTFLFLFCASTSLNCILGSEDEARFAENMRRDFGKKSITEEDKKVELLTPEPVEELLIKSAVERKKSSIFSFKKGEVPNCYLRKWTGAKSSIKHDLFLKKDIQIPKTKGIYEEHDVQFLFIEADPKPVPMMKCSCQIIFFDNLEEIDSDNSSGERAGNRHLPSGGEIKEEITMDLVSHRFSGMNENKNEVRSPAPSEVLPVQNYQISRHDYNEANFTSNVHITEDKQQISSRKQEEESTGIQKPNNNAVDMRTEVHRDNDDDDSSLEDEKDRTSTPTSPKDPKGGFLVNLKDKFKRLWPWGRSKTDEEIHNDEHVSNLASDKHKVTDERESPQKTVEDVEGYKFETKSEREKLEITAIIKNEKNVEHFSSEEYRNHENSTHSSKLLRESSQSNEDSKGKRPEEITTTGKYLTEHSSFDGYNYRTVSDFHKEHEYAEKLDSHHSMKEPELLSVKTRNRSSAGDKETFKISGSMSVVGKERNESLSTSTKSSHQISQAYTHKHISNEKLNNSGQVTTKSVLDANRIDDQQNTGSNSPNTGGQGIMGSIVGSLGGLLGRFSGQTKIEDEKAKDSSSSSEEDGEYTNGKLIIVPPKIIKSVETIYMGNALERRADTLQEGDPTIAHRIEVLHEDVEEIDSKKAELNYNIVEYSHQKKENELPNDEDEEKTYKEEVIRLQTKVSDNNNDGEVDQVPSHHYEKLMERNNSRSSSQEDGKYEQLRDPLAAVERVHQQENNNKKGISVQHPDGELIMLTQSGKEIEEISKNVGKSHTTNETVLETEHLDEHDYNFEKVSEIKEENKIALDSSSSSSSSSSGESENKENSKKKLKKRNEDTAKKQSGEELGDGESKKEKMNLYQVEIVGKEDSHNENVIEKEVGNVVRTDEYEDIFIPGNTIQGESNIHSKSERTMYEQEIEVKNLESMSSDEKLIQRGELELMKEVVQSPRQTETTLQIEAAKEGENNNHHLKYEEKLRENVEHEKNTFDEINNPLIIENDWHKQEESTRIKSSLAESQYQQNYVEKIRVEGNKSDSSSASNDEKRTYPEMRVVLETDMIHSNNNEDKDGREGNTNHQLFRRSPEYILPRSSTKKIKMEKKYRYASEIPSESICVQEDGGQFLYLSKGHLKDKSFFVYRKTTENKFHVIAYIILS